MTTHREDPPEPPLARHDIGAPTLAAPGSTGPTDDSILDGASVPSNVQWRIRVEEADHVILDATNERILEMLDTRARTETDIAPAVGLSEEAVRHRIASMRLRGIALDAAQSLDALLGSLAMGPPPKAR